MENKNKKPSYRKLTLKKVTIAKLNERELKKVLGGNAAPYTDSNALSCFGSCGNCSIPNVC